MKKMKKIALLLTLLVVSQYAKAQDRVITTGVPFLLIAADARSAGMADMGVATSTDAFSQQYNPAKYAFSLEKQGFSVSYTPYLTSIANDISLGQLTYYNKINDRSAFAGSFRFFGLAFNKPKLLHTSLNSLTALKFINIFSPITTILFIEKLVYVLWNSKFSFISFRVSLLPSIIYFYCILPQFLVLPLVSCITHHSLNTNPNHISSVIVHC